MAKKKTAQIIENRIKEVLRDKGIIPTELAKTIGVSDSYMSRIISAHVPNVTVKTALKIAHALDVKVENIFTLTSISANKK